MLRTLVAGLLAAFLAFMVVHLWQQQPRDWEALFLSFVGAAGGMAYLVLGPRRFYAFTRSRWWPLRPVLPENDPRVERTPFSRVLLAAALVALIFLALWLCVVLFA